MSKSSSKDIAEAKNGCAADQVHFSLPIHFWPCTPPAPMKLAPATNLCRTVIQLDALEITCMNPLPTETKREFVKNCEKCPKTLVHCFPGQRNSILISSSTDTACQRIIKGTGAWFQHQTLVCSFL